MTGILLRNSLLAGVLLLAWPAGSEAWNTLPSRATDTPGFVYTPSPADWRAINIYQIVTDRFSDGDASNNNAQGGYDSFNGNKAHGGDFQGIQNKLNYLQTLGVNAIWISPVSLNINQTSDVLGNVYVPYHGYQPTDLNSINPYFGNLAALRNLVDAAHARGIYVILDIVPNHLADLMGSNTSGNNNTYLVNEYNDPIWHHGYSHAAPFDDLYRFHRNGRLLNYDDANQYIRGELTGGLDDIKTEDSGVRTDLQAIYKGLISATDCDGFRVDAVKHIELDFWQAFVPSMLGHATSIGKTNFLCFGEVFSGNDAFVGSFTGADKFRSMLYFPMHNTMDEVFVGGQATHKLVERLDSLNKYDSVARQQMVGFLDNHDVERMMYSSKMNGDFWKLKPALAWLYTSPQIPSLYYGTEQLFNGGVSPYNREDMFDGNFEFSTSLGDNFNTNSESFVYVQNLNRFRAQYPVLTTGTFTQRWDETSGSGIFAFSRYSSSNEALVVLNTHANSRTCFPVAIKAPGTKYLNLFNTNEVLEVGAGGTLPVTILGRDAKIFVPAGEEDPFIGFVMDGQLDAGAQLASANNGLQVYTKYDAEKQVLYVAGSDARNGNDHFILLGTNFTSIAAPWAKTGTVALSGPFIGDEFDGPFVGWFGAASAIATSSASAGGWTEGAIHLPSIFSNVPSRIYLALAPYGTADGSALASNAQVALTANGNGNVDSNEVIWLDLPSNLAYVPARIAAPTSSVVAFQVDGSLSGPETNWLRGANGMLLYAQFNGRDLYVATQDAGEGNDHFILLTDNRSVTQNAPWAKSGFVAGLKHFLADENDHSFNGWFINGAYDASRASFTPTNNGGYLEGSLNLVDVFGRIPSTIYLSVALYQNPDGGALLDFVQIPSGNTNGNVDVPEYVALDLSTFDSDGDGIADLSEDANRNGILDAGETAAFSNDTDADGSSDGDESVIGSDALLTSPPFECEQAVLPASGIVRLIWSSATGRTYFVKRSAQLVGPTWQNVTTNGVSGTGAMMQVDISATNPVGFYTISVNKP